MFEKSMSRLAGVSLLFLIAAVAWSRDNYPRQKNIDVLQYRIGIELDDSTDLIKGRTEIICVGTGDRFNSITLDFAGMIVENASENGRPAVYARSGDRCTVSLAESYARGDTCRLTISYRGRPSEGLIIKKNKFGDRTIFADNWPNRAHHWFPSIDHPYDKATVEFLVTAPTRFDVVANGKLVETRSLQNGFKLTHWRESVPIPTYCMVIGAAEFSVIQRGEWKSIPLSYYLYPKDREHGIKDYGRALEMMEFYSTLVGPYPYEKLALVQSSTRYGGMENSSAIFFSEQSFNGTGRMEGTVAHEIAHQWFGDAVTEDDWHHLWLSEGFATYFGSLFFEDLYGPDTLKSIMKRNASRILSSDDLKRRPIYDTTVTDLMKLLNSNNYQKGGWVLHMLRGMMGDQKFFAGIRDYYNAYKNGNTRTSDLQRIMERHAGTSLERFFRQWVFESGYPELVVSHKWDAKTKKLTLHVTQQQEGTVFETPLTIEVEGGGKKVRKSFLIDKRFLSITVDLPARPSRITIDPDEWTLKEMKLEPME